MAVHNVNHRIDPARAMRIDPLVVVFFLQLLFGGGKAQNEKGIAQGMEARQKGDENEGL